jgi:uncharacterized membrane protein
MLFQISIILHIIGFTFLMGGILVGLRAARMSNPPLELLKSIRFGYILAGSVLLLVTGFYQIIYHGFPYYMSQGWFHGKLTSGLLIVGLGLFLFIKFAQVEQNGQALSRKFTAILHSVVGLLFFATVALVILGRA